MKLHPNSSIRLRLCSIAVIALVMAAVLPAQPAADSKIESGLLTTLTGNPSGSTPFFVVFQESASLDAASQVPDREQRGRAVVQILQETANRTQAGVQAILRARGADFTSYWVVNSIYVPNGNLGIARALATRPEVSRIEPEPVISVPPVIVEEAPIEVQSIEWGINKIRAPEVWPTTKGAGIVVANIDTGVRYTHNAVVDQYRGNNGDGTFDHSGNWKDPSSICGATPCDNNNHGTHTMGTMVGDDDAGNQIGVAPEAEWISCKGCSTNSCSGSHLITCGQWILDPNEDSSGSDQPDIVNNSWSGGGGNNWYMGIVDGWRAAGIFPAFANGNSGPNCGTAGSPGDYFQSFASGATDIGDNIASFSSRGPSAFGPVKPDVSAPGVSVRSSTASGDSSYSNFSGTSMASPHTAGSVALMWAADPALRGDIAATEALLRGAAVDLGPGTCGGTLALNNTFGEGRIDVKEAVGGEPPPPNDPPDVTISAPANGTNVTCPATVEFTAMATDTEDDDTALTASLSWTDNGDPLGSGGSASKLYSCLDSGSHVIDASVTDSGGAGGSDSITIQVNNDPPEVTILTPADGSTFDCDTPVSFTGEATDTEDIDLTSAISWTDNAANFGSGGSASKTFSCSTETGSRTIQSTAVDSGGASGNDTISITINGGVCEPKRASCTANSECCSNKCKGKAGNKSCK